MADMKNKIYFAEKSTILKKIVEATKNESACLFPESKDVYLKILLADKFIEIDHIGIIGRPLYVATSLGIEYNDMF